ncbi:MAG: ThuA domain-containing protein [Myxococcota bacterium]|nr:ThuA domain-containing protein [Myxococcota bacterium]
MRVALFLGLAACGSSSQLKDAATEDGSADAKPDGKVLLFSRTGAFRHGPQIDRVLERLPPRFEALGIAWSSTEQPLAASDLAGVGAVFFLYTSGNDIVADRAAFESFIRGGGAFIGLHSATDTEYTWPFYQELVVAAFLDHPPGFHTAAIDILAPQHEAVANLPARWVASDEWYNFRSNPGAVAGVQVLANLDETTYTGGSMGAMHPIVWSHEKLGGRAIYSAAGHPIERWDEPAFVDHVVGMVTWALR